MRASDEAEFRDYVNGHFVALRRTAFFICGDWHRAEDIVQTALTKLYRSWRRVRDPGAVDAYARQTVVRTCLDERRRAWHREDPTEAVPDSLDAGDEHDTRLLLLRALREVPARQRAAIVLRYWEDLSIEETAHLLDCSEGTVKSSTARGLDSLRLVLARHGFAIFPKES